MKRLKNLREKTSSFFLSASAPSPRLPRRSAGAGVKNIPESERETQKAERDAIDDIQAAGKSSGHSEIKAHRADSGESPAAYGGHGSNGTRIAKAGKYAGLGIALALIAWLSPPPPPQYLLQSLNQAKKTRNKI